MAKLSGVALEGNEAASCGCQWGELLTAAAACIVLSKAADWQLSEQVEGTKAPIAGLAKPNLLRELE
jgi:hypothetical protein